MNVFSTNMNVFISNMNVFSTVKYSSIFSGTTNEVTIGIQNGAGKTVLVVLFTAAELAGVADLRGQTRRTNGAEGRQSAHVCRWRAHADLCAGRLRQV